MHKINFKTFQEFKNYFKKYVEQKKVQKMLDKLIIAWIVALGLMSLVVLNTNDTLLSRVLGISNQVTSTPPTNTPIPTFAPLPTSSAENVPCGPGQNSGQYVYLKTASECQSYIDCQLNDGSWKLMTKSECDVVQNKTNSGTKIDCVGPDGKHFPTAQKECDNFNAAWGSSKSNQQTNIQASSNIAPPSTKSTTKDDLISCSTKMGTFQLTQYECNEYNRILSQYVECTTVFSHYSWLTASECEQYKIQDAAFVNKLNNIANPATPTPVLDNSYNQQQNSQCKTSANNWYTNQGTQCSGSCAEAIKQLAYPEYQQKLKDCDSQYPL